jgi:spermidine synthase
MPRDSAPELPWWKKYLSYLFEIHIESHPSRINPHLYVCLRNGRYQLCTDLAIYSYEDLYQNFSRAFQRIDFETFPVRDVLLLGLGLGSVPLILEKYYDRSFHFTCVEIDSHVIELASRYALPRIRNSVEIVEGDALSFLESTEMTFDMAVMDIFIGDYVPEKFNGPEFLRLIRKTLRNDGIFLFNRLSQKKSDIRDSRAYFEDVFLPEFSDGTYIDVKGNYILINDHRYIKAKE